MQLQPLSPSTATSAVAPISDNELGFVPFKALVGAIAQWVTMDRAGETMPVAETSALPVDQVATESATLLWHLLGQHGASAYWTPPALGERWIGQGGIYAGQVREDDGSCYHLILADDVAERLTFDAATSWASTINADGHSDFVLPSRRASAQLYANFADVIGSGFAWTSTQYSRHDAWYQSFGGGLQSYGTKGYKLRARAVRRFIP